MTILVSPIPDLRLSREELLLSRCLAAAVAAPGFINNHAVITNCQLFDPRQLSTTVEAKYRRTDGSRTAGYNTLIILGIKRRTFAMSHSHSHDHSHDATNHGHTHEILEGPGSYISREKPLVEKRDWNDRAFTIGIGGFVHLLVYLPGLTVSPVLVVQLGLHWQSLNRGDGEDTRSSSIN